MKSQEQNWRIVILFCNLFQLPAGIAKKRVTIKANQDCFVMAGPASKFLS